KTNSEISMSIFEVRSSDEENTPANDRFSKADGYHAIPPPITGNYLTPIAEISFAVVSNPKINREKVIIEDWNSDDEDDVSEVQIASPSETQTVKTRVDKIGQTSQKQGIGFKKIKACFVCKRVLTRTGLVNPVKPNKKKAIHTASTTRPVSTARLVSTARPVGTFRPFVPKIAQIGNPEIFLQDHAVVDSCCSSHMTGNKAYLSDYEGWNDIKKSSLDLKNHCSLLSITCLYANATKDESITSYGTGTQDSYVAGSSGKDKEPTQEYILLPLHPHRTRIPVEDVAPAAHEKPLKSANAGESSFVYLGGKIPIDASTLPNADLPIDPNMPDLEDDSDAFLSDGIFKEPMMMRLWVCIVQITEGYLDTCDLPSWERLVAQGYRQEVSTPSRQRKHEIQRISLTGFPAQSVGSSNTDVLDSPCLLVLITGTSQSRQHGKSESDSYYLSD
ncbi:hypothetical protein Tco_1131449, partial [Tanacetum coccineum]